MKIPTLPELGIYLTDTNKRQLHLFIPLLVTMVLCIFGICSPVIPLQTLSIMAMAVLGVTALFLGIFFAVEYVENGGKERLKHE